MAYGDVKQISVDLIPVIDLSGSDDPAGPGEVAGAFKYRRNELA